MINVSRDDPSTSMGTRRALGASARGSRGLIQTRRVLPASAPSLQPSARPTPQRMGAAWLRRAASAGESFRRSRYPRQRRESRRLGPRADARPAASAHTVDAAAQGCPTGKSTRTQVPPSARFAIRSVPPSDTADV